MSTSDARGFVGLGRAYTAWRDLAGILEQVCLAYCREIRQQEAQYDLELHVDYSQASNLAIVVKPPREEETARVARGSTVLMKSRSRCAQMISGRNLR